MKRRPRRRLPAALTLVLALFGLGLVWSFAAPTTAADSKTSANVIAQGREVFLSDCATCHGVQAQGSEVAPSLIGVGAAAVDFQVSTGRMPLAQPGPQAPRGRPKYDEATIHALAAYVASLGPGPGIPNVDISNASVARGGDLFRENCAQCHNFAGHGGALEHGAYAPALDKATPTQVVEAMRTGPENMPRFSSQSISDKDANDIAAYVVYATRHSADVGGDALGHVGPIPEGLVIWIIGIGALVGFTVWIGQRA